MPAISSAAAGRRRHPDPAGRRVRARPGPGRSGRCRDTCSATPSGRTAGASTLAGSRGLGVRPADPLDGVAPARRRAAPPAAEHDVLRDRGGRVRPPLPRAARARRRRRGTGRDRDHPPHAERRDPRRRGRERPPGPGDRARRPGRRVRARRRGPSGGDARAQPRGDFDRWFLDAIRREAARRPTCQSARLLHETDLAGWMARSPWASADR